MNNIRICFVILHYKTADDTIKCIESIRQLDKQVHIVVVDNASGNGSIEKVEERFKETKEIYYVKNKENLGFASGNNAGYGYARDVLKDNMIAVLNNDIIIDDKDFITKVEEIYSKDGFYVAGPDIESSVDQGHQSPMNIGEGTKKSLTKAILRYRILYILSKLGIYDMLRKIRGKGNDIEKKHTIRYKEKQINAVLHGAFVIFSPDFVKKEKISFRKGTFLYLEENILYRYCMSHNYKMVYTPELHVLHKEDSSTSSMFNSDRKKREFVFKNMIKSIKVYRKYV